MRDLVNPSELKKHLQQFGLWAKKSLGQHFLISRSVVEQMIEAAELNSSDAVIEVGPGPGALSQRIAPICNTLQAVELDQEMIPAWQKLMKPFDNASVLHQDALTYEPTFSHYKMVANIPYYITSPLLKHFLLETKNKPSTLVFLMQKEVAQRVCDTKKPSLISWQVRLFGDPEYICHVPPESFLPPPKVDSAVLKVTVHPEPLVPEQEALKFLSFLELCYHQPRKTLLNNLLAAGRWSKEDIETIAERSRLNLGLRPHQLALEDWLKCSTFWKDS